MHQHCAVPVRAIVKTLDDPRALATFARTAQPCLDSAAETHTEAVHADSD